MKYSQAISGVSAGYYERKDRYNQRSVRTDIYINKTLEIVNEKSTKLYRPCHVVKAIEQLQAERGLTQEQAAKYIRDAAIWWRDKGGTDLCL